MSVDLSPRVALATSVGLREAESQTYVLDLHQLGPRRNFRAQVFTNDEDNEGATLQQVLELLGSRDTSDEPRFRRLVAEPPPGIGNAKIRRTLGLVRGEPVPEGLLFEAEVDSEELLRMSGYPDARVEASLVPVAGKDKVDLELEIEPGARVDFAFEGIVPEKSFRRSITSLYRMDFYEEASIEEMRRQTERVLQAAGYLEPEVEIEVTEETGEGRRVVIRSRGDERLEIDEPRFVGLSAEEAELLAARFDTPLRRAELATGRPEADQYLLSALAALGYFDAAIVGRELGDDGSLVVEVDPGPQRIVAGVDWDGFPPGLQPSPEQPMRVAAGDPARAFAIAREAAELEAALRGGGYPDALVRSTITIDPDDTVLARVRYEARPGETSTIGDVRVDGTRSAKASWLENVAGIEEGTTYSRQRVAEAQNELFRTGLFYSVGTETERLEDGSSRLVFRVEELPRLTLSYGLRYESDRGAAAVLDVVDQNLDGRGLTLGLRALYASDDQSARLYSRLPRLAGSRSALELFLETREEVREGLITDSLEASLQLSVPFGDRTIGRVYGRWRRRHIVEEDPNPIFPFEEEITSPYAGFQVIFDGRKSGPASDGLFASVDLSGSEDFLGSDFKYARIFGWTSYVRPAGSLGGMPMRWAQSYRLGIARPFDGQELLPFEDIRFFAGGAYSVRGYARNSLGTISEFFGPLGGEALLVLNQELRLSLPLDLTGVAFFDAGNVWEERQDLSLDLQPAIGLGLRWASPVGLLRLDVAKPLDRRPSDSNLELYFGFGHIF